MNNKAVGWSILTPKKLSTYIGQEVLINNMHRGVVGAIAMGDGRVRLLTEEGYSVISMRSIKFIQVYKQRVNVLQCTKKYNDRIVAQLPLDDVKGLTAWYEGTNKRRTSRMTVYNVGKAGLVGNVIGDNRKRKA